MNDTKRSFFLDIYIAAPFAKRDEVAAWAEALRHRGFGVLNRWITHRLPKPKLPFSAHENVDYANTAAREDLKDVASSDVFVLFTDGPSSGRFVEFGYALAWEIPCIVVGSDANLFTALLGDVYGANVRHVTDALELYDALEAVRVSILGETEGTKGTKREGTKHDHKKTRFELITPEFLDVLAVTLTHGARKYGDYNWTGLDASRVIGALHRHLNAIQTDETYDRETGLPHVAMIAANAMFLFTLHGLVSEWPFACVCEVCRDAT